MLDINHLLLSIKNKTLLVVFPHPDDETMATGGLIMAASNAGWKVVVVCLTKGGAGKIHVHANGYSLKEVREKELKLACRILGVNEVVLADFDDGRLKMEGGWRNWMIEKIEKYHPGLVVTYDPSGYYGHPDHITLSKELLRNFQFSILNFQLLYMAVSPKMRESLPLRGMEEVKDQFVEITHVLKLDKWQVLKKWLAARAHRSQHLGKSVKIPLSLYMAKNPYEYYHLVNNETKYKFKFIKYAI